MRLLNGSFGMSPTNNIEPYFSGINTLLLREKGVNGQILTIDTSWYDSCRRGFQDVIF